MVLRRLFGFALVAAAGAAMLVGFEGFNAAPASAYSSSVPLTIVASGCETPSWKGKLSLGSTNSPASLMGWPERKVAQVTGTAKYCVTKLRAKDSNKSADYYLLEVATSWTSKFPKNPNDKYYYGASGWKNSLKSSKATVKKEFDATPSFKKPTGDKTSISIGVGIAGVSVSATQDFVKTASVTRSSLENQSASWKSSDVTSIKRTDLFFTQAVANKSVPKYTVTLTRPYYTYSFTTAKTKTCHPYVPCYYAQIPRETGKSRELVIVR